MSNAKTAHGFQNTCCVIFHHKGIAMHELTIRKCDNGYIVQTDNGCSVVQGNLNNLYSFLDGIKFDPVED